MTVWSNSPLARGLTAAALALAVVGVSTAAHATQTKPTSAYAEAYASTATLLSVNGASGNGSFGIHVDAHTRPAIIELETPAQGFEVFAVSGGVLQAIGEWGSFDLGVHVAAGTSPAVVALNTSPPSIEVAWHGAGGYLGDSLLTNTGGQVHITSGSLGLGMAGNSSPDITATADTVTIAFAANTSKLWERSSPVASPATASYHVSTASVAAGTSPSVACVSDSACEAAFQGTNGHLWDFGFTGSGDLGYLLAGGTSPSIASEHSIYVLAFAANTLRLWRLLFTAGGGQPYGEQGDTGLGIEAGTSPSIAAAGVAQLGGATAPSWRATFASPQGVLWYVVHAAVDTTTFAAFTPHDTKARVAAGSSPVVG